MTPHSQGYIQHLLKPIAQPQNPDEHRVICEHCRGVSRNVIPYHRTGCYTGAGGWSPPQRRSIDATEARVRREERDRPRWSLGWAGVCP